MLLLLLLDPTTTDNDDDETTTTRREDAELTALDYYSITPYIHDQGFENMMGMPPPVPDGEGPYAPVWQISPPNAARNTIINLDIWLLFIKLLDMGPPLFRGKELTCHSIRLKK